MAKRYTVEFNARVKPVKPLNDEFTLCKCYVMALNKNRNLSFISKDAAEAAQPTLFNIPVIGHLYVDDEGKYRMGGHDMILSQRDDGSFEFKSICVPYGVVPQQDNVHYEDIQEPNGDIHTYIVSDVILWTGRFPELREAIYSDETYFGQSMEINVNEYEPLDEDKNYTNILDYTYSALCLLGKSDNPSEHVEPCFPMSRIDPYEFSCDDKFTDLMAQLKQELAFCFDGNSANQEGESMDETTQTVEANCETAEVNTEETQQIDTAEETQPEASEAEEQNNDATEANEAEGQYDLNQLAADVDHVEEASFSATYKEKRGALENVMPCVVEHDEQKNVIYTADYWICDFDDASVYVEKHEWRKDGGCFETKGKFSYVFNEDEATASLTSDFIEMVVKWLTKEEAAQVESMRNHYEELVEYKRVREQKDLEDKFDAAIAEFSYLSDIDEYKEVFNNRYAYESTEKLKDACYIIKGKYSVVAPQKKATSEPVVPVGDDIAPATLHERFHQRFGKK